MASPFLDVDHIVVTRQREADRRSRSSRRRASSTVIAMVWLDGRAAVHGIQALPWVRAAHVEREWPGTVKITDHRTSAPRRGSTTARVPRSSTAPAASSSASPSRPPTCRRSRPPSSCRPVGATIEPAIGAHVAGRLQGFARSGTRVITLSPGGVVLGLVNGPDIRLGEPTHVMTKVRAAARGARRARRRAGRVHRRVGPGEPGRRPRDVNETREVVDPRMLRE